MADSLKRCVFTEKYPPKGLKNIIDEKFKAVAAREYENAAKLRDAEINFYREKYGHDVRHKSTSPYPPKELSQQEILIFQEVEAIFKQMFEKLKNDLKNNDE